MNYLSYRNIIKRHGSVLRRVHLSSKTRAVSLYARREIETSSDYFILLLFARITPIATSLESTTNGQLMTV